MKNPLAIHVHQTHFPLGDLHSTYNYLEGLLGLEDGGIHLLPELFLTGYPLQDLCFHPSFIEKIVKTLRKLDQFAKNSPKKNDDRLLFFGAPAYTFKGELIQSIENSIFALRPGQGLEKVYSKQLLPSYDIFDESKYFSEGRQSVVYPFQNYNIALTICEDMWASSFHKNNPIEDLARWKVVSQKNIDLVVNLSASPYNIGKPQKRWLRGQEIVERLAAPFAYVNRVGTEDEILFDGQSFFCWQDVDTIQIEKFSRFKAQTRTFPLPSLKESGHSGQGSQMKETPWESLFAPRWNKNHSPPKLMNLSEDDCQEIIEALCFGIQDFAKQCGFSKFLVANSGGIDSALVLTLAKISLKDQQTVESLFMPGQFSSQISYDLSQEIAQKLKITHRIVPIKFFHSIYRNQLKTDLGQEIEGLTDENIQARIRATVLYARANQTGAMVLNTSNKSEIAVGYSTLYGDSVGALSVIGDLYKSEVYQLANYINKKFGPLIPEGIIERPPSAELRPNQMDSQSLPPYPILDAILEGVVSYRASGNDLVNLGFSPADVERALFLYQRSEFKRKQFAPIIKVKNKSFGFGHRVPICKDVQVFI